MTKPALSLDLVQIASPCHVSWDEMSGDERVRFCKQCSLHVYNLSDMPRDEAEVFVNQAEGRTCIRFHRRADGTLLTRDCPVGLRAVRQRLVRGAAALAGVMLALVSGTVFGGRLKNLNLPGLGRPADAYSEWIEPGSTQSFSVGKMACPPTVTILPALPEEGLIVDAPESALPEPTTEQLRQIAERLAE